MDGRARGESKWEIVTVGLQPKGCPASTQSFSVHHSSLRMEGTSQHWWCWRSDAQQIEQRLQHDALNKVIAVGIKVEANKVTLGSFSLSSSPSRVPCITTSSNPPQHWEQDLTIHTDHS